MVHISIWLMVLGSNAYCSSTTHYCSTITIVPHKMSLTFTTVSPYSGLPVQYTFLPHHIEAIQRYCVRAGFFEYNIQYDFINELITGVKPYTSKHTNAKMRKVKLPPRRQHDVTLPDDIITVIAVHSNIAGTAMINLTCKRLLPRDPIFKLLADIPGLVHNMLPYVKVTTGNQLLVSQLARSYCSSMVIGMAVLPVNADNLVHNMVRSYQAIYGTRGHTDGFSQSQRLPPNSRDYRWRQLSTACNRAMAKDVPYVVVVSEFGNDIEVYVINDKVIMATEVAGITASPVLSVVDAFKVLLAAKHTLKPQHVKDLMCDIRCATHFAGGYDELVQVLKNISAVYGASSAIELVQYEEVPITTTPAIGDPDAVVAKIPDYNLNNACLQLDISTEWVDHVKISPGDVPMSAAQAHDYRVAPTISQIASYDVGMIPIFIGPFVPVTPTFAPPPFAPIQ